MLRIYSLPEVVEFFKTNRHLIEAKLKNQPVEGFLKLKDVNGDEVTIGTGMSIFIILLMLLSLFLWVWALIVLIRYWNILPAWAQVLGVLGLITGFGPVVTLVAVYVAKGHATP